MPKTNSLSYTTLSGVCTIFLVWKWDWGCQGRADSGKVHSGTHFAPRVESSKGGSLLMKVCMLGREWLYKMDIISQHYFWGFNEIFNTLSGTQDLKSVYSYFTDMYQRQYALKKKFVRIPLRTSTLLKSKRAAYDTTEQTLFSFLRYITLEVTVVTCNFKSFQCPATIILLHFDS